MQMRSLIKFLKEVEPSFREALKHAESSTEIEGIFREAASNLILKAAGDLLGDLDIDRHIHLAPDKPKGYRLSATLEEALKPLLTETDLPALLEKLATAAVHRWQHFKNLEDKHQPTRKNPRG